ILFRIVQVRVDCVFVILVPIELGNVGALWPRFTSLTTLGLFGLILQTKIPKCFADFCISRFHLLSLAIDLAENDLIRFFTGQNTPTLDGNPIPILIGSILLGDSRLTRMSLLLLLLVGLL